MHECCETCHRHRKISKGGGPDAKRGCPTRNDPASLDIWAHGSCPIDQFAKMTGQDNRLIFAMLFHKRFGASSLSVAIGLLVKGGAMGKSSGKTASAEISLPPLDSFPSFHLHATVL